MKLNGLVIIFSSMVLFFTVYPFILTKFNVPPPEQTIYWTVTSIFIMTSMSILIDYELSKDSQKSTELQIKTLQKSTELQITALNTIEENKRQAIR